MSTERVTTNSDGTISCAACGNGPYKTRNIALAHWRKNHRKTKPRRKISKEGKRIRDHVFNNIAKQMEENPPKSSVVQEGDRLSSEIRFCMNCGHEIPVAVVMRK